MNQEVILFSDAKKWPDWTEDEVTAYYSSRFPYGNREIHWNLCTKFVRSMRKNKNAEIQDFQKNLDLWFNDISSIPPYCRDSIFWLKTLELIEEIYGNYKENSPDSKSPINLYRVELQLRIDIMKAYENDLVVAREATKSAVSDLM